MIELRELFVIYTSTPSNVVANKGITLKIPKTGILAITGPNGSGKSTLLKVLSGDLDPSAGELVIRDELIYKNKLSEVLKATVSILPQDFEFSSDSSAKNMISHNDDLTAEVIKSLGLQDIWALPMKDLERDQRQMIGLAMTLISNKPIILLDEPTKYLDAQSRERLLKTLRRVAKNRSIVIATHDLNWSKKIKDLIHIQDGKIVQRIKKSHRVESTHGDWKFVGKIKNPESLGSLKSHRNIEKCRDLRSFLKYRAAIKSQIQYFEPSQSTFDELTTNEIFSLSNFNVPSDLSPHAHQRLKTLSGGERTWVYLNFHIAKKPKRLFLLYPSLNLDSENQKKLQTLIRQLADTGTKITLFDIN